MKRRHAYRTSSASVLVVILLMIPSSRTSANPQNTQQKPAYTLEEYNAYKTEEAERDPAKRIALLDDFTAKYPNSRLLVYIYEAYLLTYFPLKNYLQTIAYADKLLAWDNLDVISRLQALVARAEGFAVGCDESSLQSPQALEKAKEAGEQGLAYLDQMTKPPAMDDRDFASLKINMGLLFASAIGIAESRMKGSPIECLPAPPATPRPSVSRAPAAPGIQFNQIIQELLDLQRRAPGR